ncbi:glycosyltransferase family 2 protein [Aeromonas media]|uniref:glycosyltransferase family 2 protein n=1 Tax=Aeromonas media TaxID=651 RepID=UPI003D1A7D08
MIIIPMAGLSSRFFKAGYTKPKYMLDLNGESLFDTCLKSFSAYFESEHFLFIVRDVYATKDFVNERVKHLGIASYSVEALSEETRGQAETVSLGLQAISNLEQPITIFNIDTIRPGFSFPDFDPREDSYLEVFKGTGDNWSFVKPVSDQSNEVILTTEKNPVSDLCCTGLYHFASASQFIAAYNYFLQLPKEQWDAGELYVAPLYNHIIRKHLPVKFHLIGRDEVIFCGTPTEYEALKTNL